MSLSKSLKCRVDVKSCSFNEEWIDKYTFMMQAFRESKPVCLVCNKIIALANKYSLNKHSTEHAVIKESYPEVTVGKL